MADRDEGEGPEISGEQKKEIAKWLLTNAPAGEIQYVAKDVRSVLMDDVAYEAAAAVAFPIYNKAHLLSLAMPDRSGDVIISKFGEIDSESFLDPRTAQVAIVDHVKQICTKVRPATDEELPCSYIEEFRALLDAELCKYVDETYSKGTCAVYCTKGKTWKDQEQFSNLRNGSWRSIWIVEFKDDLQVVELKGKLQVGAHYFEEGNVQLDSTNECKDSTMVQSPDDSAISIANIIRHHETEYMASLEGSYFNLPDTTFKDLRRKLPVTRTLFPWHSTSQFSLTREISKELGIGK
ncbi:unnamed protein product [Spirodela intermedia]|uniref:F-actin-capping protein subunit alpha n=1 Tax=Spirodela intermedia TaxID=51605 RepID=A0A7I8IA49_SPIIN|nr:unnamed protein product [Spirodela intermedia]CAA6654283.1 unnamed protein product [Spirodela intermedia]